MEETNMFASEQWIKEFQQQQEWKYNNIASYTLWCKREDLLREIQKDCETLDQLEDERQRVSVELAQRRKWVAKLDDTLYAIDPSITRPKAEEQ